MTGLFLLGVAVVLTQVPDLNRLQWHSRVVLLFARDSRDFHLARQKFAFESSSGDLAERDTTVFDISGDDPGSCALRKELGISDVDFAVILIGKDGSIKVRRSTPIAPAELFRIIDSMPMRRDEMRRRK